MAGADELAADLDASQRPFDAKHLIRWGTHRSTLDEVDDDAGREGSVVADLVDPRRGHQRSEAAQQLRWRERDQPPAQPRSRATSRSAKSSAMGSRRTSGATPPSRA